MFGDDPNAASDDDPATAEADLWFLPGPPEDAAPTDPPWPQADRRALVEPGAWQAAEAGAAVALARAAAAFGALDERLRQAPPGWRHRLALIEVAELGWLAGDRIPADRLAQYHALRLAGAQDDSLALARAGWALRRLTGGPDPETDLAGFLGRAGAASDLGPDPGSGAGSAPLALSDWDQALAGAAGLHPLSRAALAYRIGQLLMAETGPGRGGAAAVIEPAVAAARIAAAEGRGGLPFQPLAQGGMSGLRARGPLPGWLADWYRGAETAALACLLHLDRLAGWQARGHEVLDGLSGRTPPRLLAVLAEWPLVSAPMAEALTGASRAAVQRNLARFEAAGMIREVTGQGRFRYWTAAV